MGAKSCHGPDGLLRQPESTAVTLVICEHPAHYFTGLYVPGFGLATHTQNPFLTQAFSQLFLMAGILFFPVFT